MKYRYTVILEKDREEGGYVVTVPALPGCISQGETVDEALKMAKDAIQGYLEALIILDVGVKETEEVRIYKVDVELEPEGVKTAQDQA